MTLTKAMAALCGTLLVLLLAKWAAFEVYEVGGHHGEQSYVVDTGSEVTDDAGADDVNFEELLASADIDKGARVFKKCSACHKLEAGANGTGPYLYGVVGRPIGTANGFGYSSAMGGHGGDWTPAELDAFLTKPSDFVPGTTMSFAGLKKAEDRANVIAYLDSLDN